MLAVNDSEAAIIKKYIKALIREFPDLNDALKLAKVMRIDVDKRIEKNLTREKVERIKLLLKAMNSELDPGAKSLF